MVVTKENSLYTFGENSYGECGVNFLVRIPVRIPDFPPQGEEIVLVNCVRLSSIVATVDQKGNQRFYACGAATEGAPTFFISLSLGYNLSKAH